MTQSDDDIIVSALSSITADQWTHLHELAAAVDPHDPGGWLGGNVMSRTSEGKPVIAMPFYMYSRELNTLVETLYSYNFVAPIAWGRWSERNGTKIIEMDAATSSTTDLVKYIVTILRSDRFSEGYLGSEIRAGRFLTRLLAVIDRYRPAAT